MSRRNIEDDESYVCHSWMKTRAAEAYKELSICARELPRALRRRSMVVGAVLHRCATAIEKSRNEAGGLEIIRSCVRRGLSHGLLQPKRR